MKTLLKKCLLVLPLWILILIPMLFINSGCCDFYVQPTPTPTPIPTPAIVRQYWSSESMDGNSIWWSNTQHPDIEYRTARQADLVVTLATNEGMATAIYVDTSSTYQTFSGFGASFEGSTIHNLLHLSPARRKEVLNLLIDPVNGASFSLFRICIGTSDFSPESWGWYSLDDVGKGETDPNLDHFYTPCPTCSPLPPEDQIISVLREAIQVADSKGVDLRLVASAWSPPAWMKDNNNMVRGSLQTQYNDLYAQYLYRFLVVYYNQGIPIYAITVQNEPGWTTDYPSTCITPQQQADIIRKLKTLIDADPVIKTKILAHDWNFDDTPRSANSCLNDGYTHIQLAKDVLSYLSPPYSYVYGVSLHSYDWDNNDEDNITGLHNLYSGLQMMHTEKSEFGAGGMGQIVKLFRHWSSTYVSWVTMLDNDNADENPDEDEHFPGTATPPDFILDASNTENYWITPAFYLKQQFSKFIQLGAKRIYSSIGTWPLSNVAFLNPDNTIVLIVVNQSENEQAFRAVFDLNQFTAKIPGKVVATYIWCTDNIAINLAAGKTAASSSNENDINIAANITDCDPDTRWASGRSDDQWIYIDLDYSINIERIMLDWETAYGLEYEIQVSEDAVNWTTIYHETNGSPGIHIYNVDTKGRYVKMKGIARGTEFGYSIYECEIY